MNKDVNFLIVEQLNVESKNETIESLIQELDKEGYLKDKGQFYLDVLERENSFPTYIGNEIGLPHSQSIGVENPCIVIGKLTKDIVWTEDDEKVNLIFLIAVPKENEGNLRRPIHLQKRCSCNLAIC